VLRCSPDIPRETLQPIRGWTDQEWDAATARLVERGWLRPDGTISAEGRARHATLEAATDLAASRPWAGFHRQELDELTTTLRPIATRCRAELPAINPIGIPTAS
jgi:hypothetical protein